ncbi:hypothetical protein JXA85_07440 [Candidatus Woesearchaeota archaeon]|nr:hypothetical protein [Candidatus Woesearchaeota archaeon]
MKMKKISRKATFFLIPLVILGVLIALPLAIMKFDNTFKIDKYRYIGEGQLNIFRAFMESEKAIIYIEDAARFSLHEAIIDLGKNSGFGSESKCGRMGIFNRWSDEKESCKPGKIEENIKPFLNEYLDYYVMSYSGISIPASNYQFAIKRYPDGATLTGYAESKPILNLGGGSLIPFKQHCDNEALKAIADKYGNVIRKELEKAKSLDDKEMYFRIVIGIIAQESFCGVETAVSPTGCTGLMGVCGGNKLEMVNAEPNIAKGIEILNGKVSYFRKYESKMELGLAAYNGGEGVINGAIQQAKSSLGLIAGAEKELDWKMVSQYVTPEVIYSAYSKSFSKETMNKYFSKPAQLTAKAEETKRYVSQVLGYSDVYQTTLNNEGTEIKEIVNKPEEEKERKNEERDTIKGFYSMKPSFRIDFDYYPDTYDELYSIVEEAKASSASSGIDAFLAELNKNKNFDFILKTTERITDEEKWNDYCETKAESALDDFLMRYQECESQTDCNCNIEIVGAVPKDPYGFNFALENGTYNVEQETNNELSGNTMKDTKIRLDFVPKLKTNFEITGVISGDGKFMIGTKDGAAKGMAFVNKKQPDGSSMMMLVQEAEKLPAQCAKETDVIVCAIDKRVSYFVYNPETEKTEQTNPVIRFAYNVGSFPPGKVEFKAAEKKRGERSLLLIWKNQPHPNIDSYNAYYSKKGNFEGKTLEQIKEMVGNNQAKMERIKKVSVKDGVVENNRRTHKNEVPVFLFGKTIEEAEEECVGDNKDECKYDMKSRYYAGDKVMWRPDSFEEKFDLSKSHIFLDEVLLYAISVEEDGEYDVVITAFDSTTGEESKEFFIKQAESVDDLVPPECEDEEIKFDGTNLNLNCEIEERIYDISSIRLSVDVRDKATSNIIVINVDGEIAKNVVETRDLLEWSGTANIKFLPITGELSKDSFEAERTRLYFIDGKGNEKDIDVNNDEIKKFLGLY